MNQLLKSGSFLNVRGLIASSQIPQQVKTEVLSLYDAATRSPEAISECQVRLDRAFRVFLESTQIPHKLKDWSSLLVELSVAKKSSNKDDPTTDVSFTEFKHRNTEHLQRRAMLELHIANLCLEAVGANAEIRYMTFSTRLFDFVSNLTKSLRVPIVHPRFVFAYRSSDFFSEIKDGFDSILAAFSGSLEVIERDQKVTRKEVNKVEKFNRFLQPLRDTNAFSAVLQEKFSVSNIIDGIREAIRQLDKIEGSSTEVIGRTKHLSSAIGARLSSIEEMLNEGVSQSARIFSRYSTETAASDIYELFRDLTDDIETENQPRILARLVSGGSDKPLRMICLPVTGAYRYMFSITNTDVIENEEIRGLVSEELSEFKLERFTEMLERAVTKADSVSASASAKNGAMLHFVRAFHAASYRDWPLSELLAKRGLEEIERVELAKRSARFFLLKHELLFLRHLAARGLAERQTSGRGQISALVNSMQLLRDSATAVDDSLKCEDGAKNFLGGGPFLGAMTFRIALAFAASMLELLIVQRQSVDREQANISVDDIVVFSPRPKQSDGLEFAWHIAGFEQISVMTAWNDPRKASEGISQGLLALIGKIEASLEKSRGEIDNREFDMVLWKYRQIRCEQVIHFLAILVERDYIFGVLDNKLRAHIKNSQFCDLAGQFKTEIKSLMNGEPPDHGGFVPFVTVVCSYFSWRKKEGDDGLTSLVSRLEAFEGVRLASSNLDPLGLPRRISSEILAEWSKVLVRDLEWSSEFVEAFVPE